MEKNTDFEVCSLDTICVNESVLMHKWYHTIKYMIVGIAFGIVFVTYPLYQPHIALLKKAFDLCLYEPR